MAILLSASALGAPDLFKLRNQTAAYWAAQNLTGWQQAGVCVRSLYLFIGPAAKRKTQLSVEKVEKVDYFFCVPPMTYHDVFT